jgi:putative transposase
MRNEYDVVRHVDYLDYNPVKHNLGKHVALWPYSTFHRYVNRGVYPRDRIADPGDIGGDSND